MSTNGFLRNIFSCFRRKVEMKNLLFIKIVLYSMKKKSGKLLQSPQAANEKRNKPLMDLCLILFIDCCNTVVFLLFANK